ncbi:putative zn(2)-C6 fungal-type DNA-binding domain-containing protein [Septoria linicola]|nr:putative zn(2)-C6 fungal-type DNA-binding domain-containing protein [Septoria linicola]
MDSGSSRQHSSALPAENLLSSLAKRTPARAACERCRRRKIRCEGERPCSKCTAAKAECVYTTQQHETERQAAKRKFNEITTSHEQLRKVHEFLVGASQDNASTALRLLRDQKSLENVLTWIASLDQSISQSHQQLNYQEFATALYNLPSRDALAALQDRIISLGDVLGVLAQSNPTSDTSLLWTFTAVESLCSSDDNELELRLHWVPASPWLDSRIAERGVSRLISTFIWTVNPYWRLLEADLFLRHMRIRKLDRLYCSPLLVNAVLACAAMFSEDEEAFTNPGDLLTRGEQYHNEATRLWQAERGRESIATLQALIILSCEYDSKATQDQPRELLAESPPLHVAADPWTVQNYLRAISCARSTIMWLHLGWTVDLFRKPKNLMITIDELPDLEKVLVDSPSL